jgi:UDP-glucose 6-dehydrogenase
LNSYGDPKGLISNYFNINIDYIANTIDKCNNYFEHKKIVQLGLTFKPESDDLRDSQAIVLNNYLVNEGFEVKTFDPFINNEEELESVLSFSENIVIATRHKIFDSYDLESKKVVVVGDK